MMLIRSPRDDRASPTYCYHIKAAKEMRLRDIAKKIFQLVRIFIRANQKLRGFYARATLVPIENVLLYTFSGGSCLIGASRQHHTTLLKQDRYVELKRQTRNIWQISTPLSLELQFENNLITLD